MIKLLGQRPARVWFKIYLEYLVIKAINLNIDVVLHGESDEELSEDLDFNADTLD